MEKFQIFKKRGEERNTNGYYGEITSFTLPSSRFSSCWMDFQGRGGDLPLFSSLLTDHKGGNSNTVKGRRERERKGLKIFNLTCSFRGEIVGNVFQNVITFYACENTEKRTA